MKRKRMNLFRELKGGAASAGGASKPIKLGAHAYIGIGFVILFTSLTAPKFIRYLQESKDLSDRIGKSREDLATIMAKAVEVASRVTEERKIATIEAKKPDAVTKFDVVPIDKTWTSILWKLSTFTTDKIVVQKLDFQAVKADETGSGSSRKIIIDGNAGSQSALTDWMEQLSFTMPTAEFVMEKQANTTANNKFPIEFKVIVTIL